MTVIALAAIASNYSVFLLCNRKDDNSPLSITTRLTYQMQINNVYSKNLRKMVALIIALVILMTTKIKAVLRKAQLKHRASQRECSFVEVLPLLILMILIMAVPVIVIIIYVLIITLILITTIIVNMS